MNRDKQIPRTPEGFNLYRVFIAITLALIVLSCAERESRPVVMPDSTIIYPSRKPGGISAKITFSRFLGQKSGKQSAISTVFALKEGNEINAVIDLENRDINHDKDLMVHLDWIGPDGNSFYLKQVDLLRNDSTSSIVSSINISPGKRIPGRYLLRVYLFRELIAEKYFEVKDETEIEKVSSTIIFYKNIDKETGEMYGVDTVFEIKKKGILRAKTGLTGLGIYKDDELPFRMEWYGPDGKSFYDKKVMVNPADTSISFTGSISITPDKREPGEYALKVFLFDEMIGEAGFVLISGEIINHKGAKSTKKH